MGMWFFGLCGLSNYCEDRNFRPLSQNRIFEACKLTNLHQTTLARRSCPSGAIHQLLRAYLVAMPPVLSLEKNLAVAIGLELDLEPDVIQKTIAISKRQIR